MFLYGFAKDEQENIDPNELRTLQEIRAAWLATENKGITRALKEAALQEVTHAEDEPA